MVSVCMIPDKRPDMRKNWSWYEHSTVVIYPELSECSVVVVDLTIALHVAQITACRKAAVQTPRFSIEECGALFVIRCDILCERIASA